MLRSIGKQSGESVESVRKKKRKATVERICRKRQLKAWKACTDPDVKRSNDGMELALVCVYVCVCVCVRERERDRERERETEGYLYCKPGYTVYSRIRFNWCV